MELSTLAEIQSAVEALPLRQQEELLRHLLERLKEDEPRKRKRRLPPIPTTGMEQISLAAKKRKRRRKNGHQKN